MAVYAKKDGFAVTQALEHTRAVAVEVGTGEASTAVGVPVMENGDLPDVGLDWVLLNQAGFEGKVGQTYVVLRSGRPATILIGVGDRTSLDTAKIRDAAAAFARAARTHRKLSVALGEPLPQVATEDAVQAMVEGVLLARYSYDPLKTSPATTPLESFTMTVDGERSEAVATGVERGRATATATILSRDLANTPPGLLDAVEMGNIAEAMGAEMGFEVELFDRQALIEMGCGGILGVNAGSAKEPRLIKLIYRPDGEPKGSVALVGKGITYDAGGLGIKPGDSTHATMKNDMSGAGAILGAFTALRALGCTTAVTGYLCCTDNVPSGSAMAMGDVLVTRGGKSVEVAHTDAEGRLVMADGLVLATEEAHDAIVDIATLTGAALRTFGTEIAAVIGNNESIVNQIKDSAAATDEPVWELPLARRYRAELNSPVADISNMGGPNAGSITAALFLEEFVNGLPWGHIDIAGTAQAAADRSWTTAGCTGFGARLLVDFVTNFEKP